MGMNQSRGRSIIIVLMLLCVCLWWMMMMNTLEAQKSFRPVKRVFLIISGFPQLSKPPSRVFTFLIWPRSSISTCMHRWYGNYKGPSVTSLCLVHLSDFCWDGITWNGLGSVKRFRQHKPHTDTFWTESPFSGGLSSPSIATIRPYTYPILYWIIIL